MNAAFSKDSCNKFSQLERFYVLGTHTLYESIPVREVAEDHSSHHHSQEKDGARGFRQAFTVTNQIPLKKKKHTTEKKRSQIFVWRSFGIKNPPKQTYD